LHAFEPPEHRADFAQIQPRQCGFDPLVRVLGIAVLRLRGRFKTLIISKNQA
jgi:hypothetical protein